VPRPLARRRLVRALERLGFIFVSQRGSHLKFKRAVAGGEVVVIVPNYREIPEGTVNSILAQAGITWEQLEELL
jgi:predicted RNA binding protein YcfA (HicA-like mRNA interferase family)